MTATVLEAINQQVSNEFTASFSYLSMAAWCEHHKFMGAGAWLRAQSAEEHTHAHAAVQLPAGAQPPGDAARHRSAASRLRVARSSLRAGAGAGAGREQADRRALRTGVPARRCSRRWPSCSGSSPSRSKKKRPCARSSPSSRWSATTRRRCSISIASSGTAREAGRPKARARESEPQD